MKFEDFGKRWNSISSGFLLVDGTHSLNLSYGLTNGSQKTFALISDYEIPVLEQSKAVMTEQHKNSAGKNVYMLRLLIPKHSDEFEKFCWDLLESSRGNSEEASIKLFTIKYKRWMSFFAKYYESCLRPEAQRGLFAELAYLEELLDSGMDAEKAVNCWQGPDKVSQDFIFESSWAEIKSVSPKATKVRISSFRQLDSANPGRLVVYFLSLSSSEDKSAMSLFDKVDTIFTRLGGRGAGEAADLFHLRLMSANYVPIDEYKKDHYGVIEKQVYSVGAGFPRLNRESLPDAIVDVSYDLDLVALIEFKEQV